MPHFAWCMRDDVMMEVWKKISRIMKECPYLFGVIILFGIMAVFVFVRNMAYGNLNMKYVKKHISEPIWIGAFETEPTDGTEESYGAGEVLQITMADVQKQHSVAMKDRKNGKSFSGKKLKNSKKEDSTEKNNTKVDKKKKERDNLEENQVGVTKFQEYKPAKINSPYYTDRGKIALTTEYKYQKVDDNYFTDAAFIGDSRTLGLYDYSGWNKKADFYCESGFSLFQWTRGEKVTFQNTGKKVDLKSALKKKKYGKVYLMFGMNDLGYGNSEKYAEWLSEMVNMVKETQPAAIIYLMGNLHMSKDKDNMKTEFNNVNVNDKNVSMALLADGITSFYLDCNPVFTDKKGYLKSDLTFDGCHLYGYCYTEWTDFIKEHAVIK